MPLERARDLVGAVLDSAGDSLHPDALDLRAADSVRSCSGQVIDHPSDLGGWPVLHSRRGARDTDSDGLPDAWENRRAGLDPDRADNPWAPDPDSGLTHIEAYLAMRAGDTLPPDMPALDVDNLGLLTGFHRAATARD